MKLRVISLVAITTAVCCVDNTVEAGEIKGSAFGIVEGTTEKELIAKYKAQMLVPELSEYKLPKEFVPTQNPKIQSYHAVVSKNAGVCVIKGFSFYLAYNNRGVGFDDSVYVASGVTQIERKKNALLKLSTDFSTLTTELNSKYKAIPSDGLNNKTVTNFATRISTEKWFDKETNTGITLSSDEIHNNPKYPYYVLTLKYVFNSPLCRTFFERGD